MTRDDVIHPVEVIEPGATSPVPGPPAPAAQYSLVDEPLVEEEKSKGKSEAAKAEHKPDKKQKPRG